MASVKVEWMGQAVRGKVRAAAVAGLQAGVDYAKEQSVQIAPRLTGELRASAYTGVDRSTLIGIVGYDVPRDVKAIKQHEDLSYHHPSGEQSKFLEDPVKAAGPVAHRKLAAELRKAFA